MKIDEALKTPTLHAADKQKVTALRAKGEDEHKAGKHADSLKTIGEEKAILKIQ